MIRLREDDTEGRQASRTGSSLAMNKGRDGGEQSSAEQARPAAWVQVTQMPRLRAASCVGRRHSVLDREEGLSTSFCGYFCLFILFIPLC